MTNNIELSDFTNGATVAGKWEGSGVFDTIMEAVTGNIEIQHTAGRITGPEYANVYLGSLQVAITESLKFILTKPSTIKDLEAKDVKIAMDEVALVESSEKWTIQKQVLANQASMSDIDLSYKERALLKDIELKDKQIESSSADIAFNESKKDIMEQTRKDNVRSKAAEQFAEFMKYISAANVIPGATDFANMRALITAMNSGISNPDAVAIITSSGADYVKP